MCCNYTRLTLVLPLRTAASDVEEKLKKDHRDLVGHLVYWARKAHGRTVDENGKVCPGCGRIGPTCGHIVELQCPN